MTLLFYALILACPRVAQAGGVTKVQPAAVHEGSAGAPYLASPQAQGPIQDLELSSIPGLKQNPLAIYPESTPGQLTGPEPLADDPAILAARDATEDTPTKSAKTPTPLRRASQKFRNTGEKLGDVGQNQAQQTIWGRLFDGISNPLRGSLETGDNEPGDNADFPHKPWMSRHRLRGFLPSHIEPRENPAPFPEHGDRLSRAILTADLVDSEGMRQGLPEHKFLSLIGTFHRFLHGVAVRNGSSDRPHGDDFTIFFAHIEDALNAAHQILAELPGFNQSRHPEHPLNIRLGLDSGKVWEVSSQDGPNFIGRAVSRSGLLAHRGHGADLVLPRWIYAAMQDIIQAEHLAIMGRHDPHLADQDAVRLKLHEGQSAPPPLDSDPSSASHPSVAVLAANLVRSHDLFRTLNPDSITSLMRGYHSLLDMAAMANNGFFAKSRGDDATLIFPGGIQDAAVAAILILQRSVELGARIGLGLTYGEILEAPSFGGELKNYLGRALSHASLLAHQANDSQLWIDSRLYPLAKPHLGSHSMVIIPDDRQAARVRLGSP